MVLLIRKCQHFLKNSLNERKGEANNKKNGTNCASNEKNWDILKSTVLFKQRRIQEEKESHVPQHEAKSTK